MLNPAVELEAVQRTAPWKRRQGGFTLFELLMTLIVAAVLLAMVVPGLANFISSSRLRASQSEFVSALTLARSEATKRGGEVVVKALGGVAGSEFLGGWQVFADTDGDGNLGVAETLIREYAPLAGAMRFSAKVGETTTNATSTTFNSRGFLKGPALKFTLCGPVGTQRGYTVRLEQVGIADVSEGSNTCT
jgi:type IV fimbrial biogenesis protein FimT